MSGDTILVEADIVQGRQLVAVSVVGDCMAPEIQPGDVLIVDRDDRTPRDGSLVVAMNEQAEVMVKRFLRDNHGEPVLVDNQNGIARPNGSVSIEGVVVSLRRNVFR